MRKILACLFCLTLLLVGGCGSPVQEKSEPLPKLTIGLMPDTDSIPFIIAAERGYFAEEGVEVELQPFKSAMDRDAALQSGNLDGAVSDLLAVIFARSVDLMSVPFPIRTAITISLHPMGRELHPLPICAARRSQSPRTRSSSM